MAMATDRIAYIPPRPLPGRCHGDSVGGQWTVVEPRSADGPLARQGGLSLWLTAAKTHAHAAASVSRPPRVLAAWRWMRHGSLKHNSTALLVETPPVRAILHISGLLTESQAAGMALLHIRGVTQHPRCSIFTARRQQHVAREGSGDCSGLKGSGVSLGRTITFTTRRDRASWSRIDSIRD